MTPVVIASITLRTMAGTASWAKVATTMKKYGKNANPFKIAQVDYRPPDPIRLALGFPLSGMSYVQIDLPFWKVVYHNNGISIYFF